MSGILGMAQRQETPVDADLLRTMTRAMAVSGPDRQRVRVLPHLGLGHALLQTRQGFEPAPQPYCLQDRYWIVVDARIDGRAELVAALGGQADVGEHSDDCVLILHAYLCWGEACLRHLIGDFVFAIWDQKEELLFCARDHFGMKLFYYSELANGLLFGNCARALRLHPNVGNSVNERALGSFLVFGGNLDTATTAFSDIQRLPPAHQLTWRPKGLQVKRYWELPREPELIRYRDSRQYRDHFLELFERAVADRIPGDRVAIAMSGGMDSTSIAAMASRIFKERGYARRPAAFTMVYKKLIPDFEEPFARSAARFLDLDWQLLTADDFELYQEARVPPLSQWPEPLFDLPTAAAKLSLWREAAQKCRVILFGEGGDELFSPSSVANLLGRMPFHQLAGDAIKSLIAYRRRPALGFRKALRRWRGLAVGQAWYPPWLDPEFERRYGFEAMAEDWLASLEDPGLHRTRPAAYRDLVRNWWTLQGEFTDSGLIQVPIETRFPFFDLRLVSFLMALPPMPWCIDKLLLRLALSGKLPQELLNRPKKPLGGNREIELLRKKPFPKMTEYESTPVLQRLVNLNALLSADQLTVSGEAFYHLRVKSLQFWLQAQGLGKT